MIADDRAAVWPLCARLGIPHSPDTVRPGQFLWDGATRHGRMFEAHPASRFDLLHEIAHWLSASAEDQRRPSFGFDQGEPVPDLHLDILAKQLGQLLERETGRPYYIDQGFVRSMARSDYGCRALGTLEHFGIRLWEGR